MKQELRVKIIYAMQRISDVWDCKVDGCHNHDCSVCRENKSIIVELREALDELKKEPLVDES